MRSKGLLLFLINAAAAERPCAAAIRRHCQNAKGVSATRQCLQSHLNKGTLEQACEMLVGTRAATVGACKAPAAALCPAKKRKPGADEERLPGAHPAGLVRFPLACLRKHLRREQSRLHGTACAKRLEALKELRERARLVKHRADASSAADKASADRRARIQAILDAMPRAEEGGLADEHARLVAAAHQADREAHENRSGFEHLPDGTHVKATKVGPPSRSWRPPPGQLRTKRRMPRPPPELHADPRMQQTPEAHQERLRKKRRKDALSLAGA
mmetsp:Transcript_13567/g.40414  ORF Transcript_13567/g.40414 Transcript_13567/m.40414 type:complete len:273 (-) Transcript_13567:58-876(-)